MFTPKITEALAAIAAWDPAKGPDEPGGMSIMTAIDMATAANQDIAQDAPTAIVMVDLDGTTDEFRRGFLAAVSFFDGVPQGRCPGDASIAWPSTTDNRFVELRFDDGNDNDRRTYRIRDGRVEFDSTGVEI